MGEPPKAFDRVEQHWISQMAKAEKTLPDDFWSTAAMQELACIVAKIEPLIGQEKASILVGIGALLCRQSRKEIEAEVHAHMAIGRAQSKLRTP